MLEFSYYVEIHECNALFMFQLTLYLGKRDFVDHIDSVDTVGEKLPTFIIETQTTGNIQQLKI